MIRVRMAPPAVSHEAPLYVRTSAAVSFADGFHEEERDGLDRFSWMGDSGRLTFAPDEAPRFLELWVLSEFQDLSQELEVTCGAARDRVPLVAGWSPLSL